MLISLGYEPSLGCKLVPPWVERYSPSLSCLVFVVGPPPCTPHSLQDMRIASGGGPLGQPSLAQRCFGCHSSDTPLPLTCSSLSKMALNTPRSTRSCRALRITYNSSSSSSDGGISSSTRGCECDVYSVCAHVCVSKYALRTCKQASISIMLHIKQETTTTCVWGGERERCMWRSYDMNVVPIQLGLLCGV